MCKVVDPVVLSTPPIVRLSLITTPAESADEIVLTSKFPPIATAPETFTASLICIADESVDEIVLTSK